MKNTVNVLSSGGHGRKNGGRGAPKFIDGQLETGQDRLGSVTS